MNSPESSETASIRSDDSRPSLAISHSDSRDHGALTLLKNSYGNYSVTVHGKFEKRNLSEVEVTSTIIIDIFNSVDKNPHKYSYNVMLITEDRKVLTLRRVNSFHYHKIVLDLKRNRTLNLKTVRTLYETEILRLERLLRGAMNDDDYSELLTDSRSNTVRIFPGGHASSKETVFRTLMREFGEETSYDLTTIGDKLLFNGKRIFKLLIYDYTVKKHFENYVFPIRVQLTCDQLSRHISPTRETEDPSFLDIGSAATLFDAFVQTQRFMIC